jgi:SAM-dependent methyltransferase
VKTIDIQRLGLRPGSRILDLGCGDGRHLRPTRTMRGVTAVGLDLGEEEVANTALSLRAMDEGHEVAGSAAADAGPWMVLRGNGYALPFRQSSFDCVIASEVLEHLHQDDWVLAEIKRVLKPGGTLAVSVPRYGPEAMCWALSDEYANSAGGHVRIYRTRQLREKLALHGYQIHHSHYAHGLHSPYWWLKCAVGVDDAEQPLVKLYHRLLVWDMFHQPFLTRALEKVLTPLMGKSVVFYTTNVGTAAEKAVRSSISTTREGSQVANAVC